MIFCLYINIVLRFFLNFNSIDAFTGVFYIAVYCIILCCNNTHIVFFFFLEKFHNYDLNPKTYIKISFIFLSFYQ